MIICQLSRGVAPVEPIIEAMRHAASVHFPYQPILGMPLIQAKNQAIALARHKREALLLIEDDILASDMIWSQALQPLWPPMTVAYASCRMRNGEWNVLTRPGTADFLSTGNCFTVIGFDVLQALPAVVFEPNQYTWDKVIEDYRPTGETYPQGNGSDRDFWYKVRMLCPGVTIKHLGRVIHLKHPLNASGWNLMNPYTPVEWGAVDK